MYVGYGGFDQFVVEGLLMVSDVGSLVSNGQLFLFLSFICLVGCFEVLGFDLLVEVFVIDLDLGVMVVVVLLGVLFNILVNLLGCFFFEQVVVLSDVCFGDVVCVVFEQYFIFGDLGELVKIYNLFGDLLM